MLDKADLKRAWKSALAMRGLSEKDFFVKIGIAPSNGNRKFSEGTVRFFEVVRLFDMLDYDVIIREREITEENAEYPRLK